TDAEIHVTFTDTSPCGPRAVSCGSTRGPDFDGDGAVEQYTRASVVLVDTDTRAVGWHVGYWLAYAFGAEDDADKPPPFRTASRDDQRSRWWE
ncbi:MAG: matrixin, partial [Halobacteriota archaeon]